MTYAMVYVCMQQFIVVFAFLVRSNSLSLSSRS